MLDLQAIVGTGLLAITAWGLLRFVAVVDGLGKRMESMEDRLNDCCERRQQTERRARRSSKAAKR